LDTVCVIVIVHSVSPSGWTSRRIVVLPSEDWDASDSARADDTVASLLASGAATAGAERSPDTTRRATTTKRLTARDRAGM
jgi:hypothetical protein